MFGRRRVQPPAVDAGDTAEAGRWAVVAPHGPATDTRPADLTGTAGWRPFGHGQHPSDQIGAYTGPPLNFFPANQPGAQLENGVSGMRSGWYFPSESAIPLGSLSVTQQRAIEPGYQRTGLQFSGLLGPLSARAARSRVTAAAVQQTSLMSQPIADLIQSWNPAPTVQSSGER